MRKSILLLFLPVLYGADPPPPPPPPCQTPAACWDLLERGNANWWTTGRSLTHPNQTPARRGAVAKKQLPFAVVLSCSDSRVPPEVIFDRGVGDLFVIRLAGNVLDDFAMGSIQYAVEVEKYNKLIVVLGHQRCGALEAAVKGTPLPNPLALLGNALKPAVDASRNWPGDRVENAVDANIHLMANKLEEKFGSIGVVVKRKRYSLDTGKVTDPQPLEVKR
ncbi:MAG TPA: carbonic anhydrase [Bryobacteraceae bacterium]